MKSLLDPFTLYLYLNTRVLIKFFYVVCLLLAAFTGSSQSNQSWKGYFSYNTIKDLAQSPTVFYAASENALFSKNLTTNTLRTINTVDGLSGQTITALYFSQAQNKTMVGYENGLIIIINNADGSMLNVVDIINKQLPPNIKKVNHFAEYEGIVYISCDFGIVQYNLATLGFGDTYFIGDNGDEIKVSQSAVYSGQIYAATSTGIRRADVTNPNLIDFSQWTNIAGGNWTGIETYGADLFAVNPSGQVSRFNGSVFATFLTTSPAPVDIRNSGEYLVVTTPAKVYFYNSGLTIAATVDNFMIPDISALFTCATAIGDTIFIGTAANGVVTTSLSNTTAFEFMIPDGPLMNNIFSINTSSPNLWAVYGEYDIFYNPFPYDMYGISKYNNNGWLNIPYSEVHLPGKDATDLVRVTVNPNNQNEVYLSSFHSGLVKFEDDVLTAQYDSTNSGLESVTDASNPAYISVRIEQSAFDNSGNLWVTNSRMVDPLKVLKADGTWTSYNLESILSNPSEANFGRMLIDKNSTKWLCSQKDGIIGFNENGNLAKKITFGADNGNLPIEDVRSAAIDNNNQLWIGTRRGLRVLSSVDRFLSESQMTANPIIILEDGVAQELLYEQYITDIVVDGANNKWIGTADSGVFLLSPNGQQTIYQFTASNSPMPSNIINDIDINGTTGEVFFATSKGMVSFKGTATDSSNDLSNVYVYPNPVRPEFSGTVKISGLIDKANIKIADIEGNLVYEKIAEGGTIEWDTTAFGKYRVASGVYMIFISSQDGAETNVKKVMVIR